MNSYTIERTKKDFLTGLRGKQRAKMLFAIMQAEVDVDHAHAQFDDHIRTQKPAIDAAINIANANLSKFSAQFREYVNGVWENLSTLVLPYPMKRVDAPFSPRYDFYDSMFANAEWDFVRNLERAMHAVLLDYRKTLGDNSSKPSIALSDDEKVEITKAVTFTKLLTASTGTDAKGYCNGCGISNGVHADNCTLKEAKQ